MEEERGCEEAGWCTRDGLAEGGAVGDPTKKVGESGLGRTSESGRDEGGTVGEPAKEVGDNEVGTD